MPSPKPEKNDVAIAQKAICLARGLSGADKAVAAAILDHFNKKTGQCDPSNERLATLLGVDPTTIRRATAALSGQHGLFIKKSHGGKSCRASYTPIWVAFRAIVDEWDRRMRSSDEADDDGENRAELPGSDTARTGQNCPPNRAELPTIPGRNALQTYLKNPSYEPISPKAPTEYDAESIETSNVGSLSQGLLRGKTGQPKPPNYEAREKNSTKGCTHADAAWQAATARIDAAVAGAPKEWREAMWLLVDEAARDMAIAAEVKRRGEGIAVIQSAMRMARLQTTRPDNVH